MTTPVFVRMEAFSVDKSVDGGQGQPGRCPTDPENRPKGPGIRPNRPITCPQARSSSGAGLRAFLPFQPVTQKERNELRNRVRAASWGGREKKKCGPSGRDMAPCATLRAAGGH